LGKGKGNFSKTSPNMIDVIGIPFETSENFLRGSALAPAHIRWHLWGIDRYSPYFKEKMPEFSDLGDIWTDFDLDPESRLNLISEKLRERIRGKTLFLGGDHTISLATIPVMREKFGEFAVLHLDAHLDRWDNFGGKYSHATVMRRLEEMGFTVGTFGYRTVGEGEYIPRFGCELGLCGLKDFVESFEKIYLSFDFDFFDPSFFPAVSNPEPMGFAFKDLIEILKNLRGKLVGIELVEYLPTLDHSLTCGTISAIVFRESLIALHK